MIASNELEGINYGLPQHLASYLMGTLSLGVKQPGCETYHSPPTSDKVKEMLIYISSLLMMEVTCSSETLVTFDDLHCFISQKTEFLYYLYLVKLVSSSGTHVTVRSTSLLMRTCVNRSLFSIYFTVSRNCW
jgi:hypothetical protein